MKKSTVYYIIYYIFCGTGMYLLSTINWKIAVGVFLINISDSFFDLKNIARDSEKINNRKSDKFYIKP